MQTTRSFILKSVAWALFITACQAGSPRYQLRDTSGRVHDSGEWRGRVVALVFSSAACPIAARYRPALDRLQVSYPDVLFLAVTPGKLAPAEQSFPTLLDPVFLLTRQVGAEFTPEVFLYDARGQLQYRGRIDDKYVDFGQARPRPTREDLRLAIEAVRAGRRVEVARRSGVGCWIEHETR